MERRKIGKEVVKWSFGIGEEGMRSSGESHGSAVIIDSIYPSWWSAARAVGLKISSIWLMSQRAVSRLQLAELVGDTRLDVQQGVPADLDIQLRACKWLLLGKGFPSVLNKFYIWNNASLRVIMMIGRPNMVPPQGWYVNTYTVDHSDVGGVTNGKFVVTSISRYKISRELVLDQTPEQDLQSVLKSSEPGVTSMNMFPPPTPNRRINVRYCGHNVVDETGLLPFDKLGIKVRTKWRGYLQIERAVTPFEQMLALDVPEKLIRVIPDDVDRLSVIEGVSSPSKVLHAVMLFMTNGFNEGSGKNKLPSDNMLSLLPSKRRKYGNETDEVIKVNSNEDTFIQMVPRIKRRWECLLEPVEEESENTAPIEIEQRATDYNEKATKSDSAEVRTELWESYMMMGLSQEIKDRDVTTASTSLRNWMLRWWKRSVTRSYFTWTKISDHGNDWHVEARDCIRRVANATWWTWDQGSRPLFWRWPMDYISKVRDGVPIWFDGKVTPWTRKQRGSPDIIRESLIREKLKVIRDKQYVEKELIISLMSFFDVPKGADDIRMVYDGSASGLNDFLWAPWFSLPTIDCLVRSLEPGHWMADNDVGEMFHNFMLHSSLRQYCGLDMTLFFKEDTDGQLLKGKLWERWNRLAMGLRTSPYCAVQGMMIAREVILGAKDNEHNVFRWDSVRLNLPGSGSYTPERAWVTKIRRDGTVAADVFVYVDDIRCSAATQLEAWAASQKTSATLAYLGLQDAARKRRDPGQETGAWTGSVVWTTNGQLSIMTTQEKWDKMKGYLKWMSDNANNKDGLNNKTLQSIRGFMVYVSRTYGSMVPYLKGLHATIDSWRSGRNANGWKLKRCKAAPRGLDGLSYHEELKWDDRFGLTEKTDMEPVLVKPVPRFRDDLFCLMSLSSSSPHRKGRMTSQARVLYGFGDASKHGFGASIELPDKSIYWRFGKWKLKDEFDQEVDGLGLSFYEERSSNYRELRNLVEALESSYEKGWLTDREIFMFTDNSTAEAAFFKGTSSSELLFDLVLRLRKLEMTGDCFIHMIHVAGTRMIHQGTDGLSRGDKTSGVMAGESMLSFVPLHRTAFGRSEALRKWMIDSLDVSTDDIVGVNLLFESDWPESHVSRGTYIWVPPPAAAEVAADYMAQSIHKRSTSTHIFICPRLMTSRWLRIVRKASDLLITIPLGSPLWDPSQHEPLIFAISFPLSRNRPWKHAGSDYCEHIGKILPKLYVEDISRASSVLRECLIRAWGMAQV